MVRRRFLAAASVTLVASLFGPVAARGAATDPIRGAYNFQSQTAATPAGYTPDFGQAYDSTRGFGWVEASTPNPLSLVGNGRDRNKVADQRLDTLMHMQYNASASGGVLAEGRWEVATMNATYDVTVAVGDASYYDSVHRLNVEGVNAINGFTPSATDKFRTATVRVAVTDGKLTVDAQGGTNTKINYLEFVEVPTGRTILSSDPADGATNVLLTTSVTLSLSHPADFATIGPTTVKLFNSAGSQIPGNYNSDGAGALVSFTPSERLSSGATYRIETTRGLLDTTGTYFDPFVATFTTGSSALPAAPVDFEKAPFDTLNAPSVLTLGPDGKLYGATAVGQVLRWTLNPDGTPAGPPESFDRLTYQRTVLGLRFDPSSTADNLVLWVSHSFLGDQDVPNFLGTVSVWSGPNLENARDVITGLPRSTRDHMNNGIDFGPDGRLYIAQGSLNGYGAPDSYWGNRAETPLSAAILVADVNGDTRFGAEVNVNTDLGYNPSAAGAPVTVYASGTRNPYDLVWHSNGSLYAPVNESASGNAPEGPGGVPAALTNLPAGNDFFAQVKAGRYYGHPNPSRGEYVLNGGNPTSSPDPFEVPQYGVGQAPDPRWDKPALDLGLHRSPNGVVEYQAETFGGALKGRLLVANFGNGDDVTSIGVDSSGTPTSVEQLASGFYNPLDVTADPVSGIVWVAEFGAQPTGEGGKITVLRPLTKSFTPVARVNFQNQTAPIPAGYTSDFGQPFDGSRGYGWIEQSTSTPLNLVGNGRDRNRVPDQRLDTLMHMQYAGDPKYAKPIPGRWELSVPSGVYDVTVAVGDPSYYDSVHRVSAEGQVLIGGFTSSAANPFATGRSQIRVTDGRLTLDAAGGTNTKLNFVTVDRVDNLQRVNFQPEVAAVPAGYARDYGQAYDDGRGFGWVAQDSGTPVSIVGNGRERSLVADQRLDTFIFMQHPGGAEPGIAVPARWEMAVTPGVYDVTVAVGDPDPAAIDSNHVIAAEGISVISGFVPDGATQQMTATVRVNVADGKLTLDAAGGTNTKIDYVDAVMAEGGAGPAPDIAVQTPDDRLMLGPRLVFSTVNEEARPARTINVINNGTDPLNVTGLSFSGTAAGDFRLASGQASSFTVPVGGSAPVAVEFLPAAGGVERYADLVIASNDIDEPNVSVPMRGLDAADYEGNSEPSMSVIKRVFGYGTQIGAESNFISNTRAPKGDEIISPYWKRSDSALPVSLIPLAHYSGRSTTAVGQTGWHVKGSTTKNQLYAFPGGTDASGGENQRLLPGITAGGTTDFATSSVFGIYTNADWSDDGKNGTAKIHNFRFWQAKTPAGAVIPNAWLVGSDIGSDVTSTVKNYDYNDEVYLLLNAEPELPAGPVPGAASLNVPFDSAVPGTVADNAGQGTGFTGVQANSAGDQYQPSLVNLDTAVGRLSLTSTAGTNSGTTNTQLNALETAFDATRKDSQAHVRLIGPFTNMTAATQYQGLFMGPDKDSFVKVEVEFRSGKPHLVLYSEINGASSLPTTPISPPGLATASSVDLYLTADFVAGRITAAYRLSSDDPAAIQPFGPSIVLGDPLKWLSRQSKAGVVVANQGSTVPFTATFDDFWVKGFTTGYSGIAWSTRAASPLTRLEAQGTQADGKIYVFGGYFDSTFAPSRRVDAFDPVSNTWENLTDMPLGTTHAGVAVVGREIWLAGGYVDNGSGGQTFATTNVWRYNLDTRGWSAGPALPEPRGSGALVALGSELHFFGGADASRADRGSHWVLAPGGSTWTAAAPLPTARSHMGYVAFRGKAWAIGGQKGVDAGLVSQSVVQAYDPATNTWTTMAALPGGRSHISGSTIVRGDLILTLGGETSHGASISNVTAYDPAGNLWKEQQRMPSARYSGVAGLVNGDLYLTTGSMTSTTFRGVVSGGAAVV